jgi:hypothetical protein
MAPLAGPRCDQIAQVPFRAAAGLRLDQQPPACLPPEGGRVRSDVPDDWDQDFSVPDQRPDEEKFRLCDLFHSPDNRLIYENDFGDSWEHEVVVEKTLPNSGARFAPGLAGARAGPPEDCGGIPGYENLVEAMADPEHPER